MKEKSLLTKVKTKVSTRTALLIAVGLIIIGGAAFGLAPLLQANKGDVNGDGKVNQADLYLMLQMADGEKSANTTKDIDGDGKITSNDVTQLAKLFTGSFLRGDMDGDRILTSKDVNILSEIYSGGIATNPYDGDTPAGQSKYLPIRAKYNISSNALTGIASNYEFIQKGDLNANGVIDQGDVALMKKLIGAIKGDMNASNIIDPSDFYILISMADGATKPVDIERGDLNGDGGISREDVMLLKKLVQGVLYRGDMNGDGKLDSVDADIISLMYSMGLTTATDTPKTRNLYSNIRMRFNISNSAINGIVSNYEFQQRGDMNGSGKIEQADVDLLKKLVSGDLIGKIDVVVSPPIVTDPNLPDLKFVDGSLYTTYFSGSSANDPNNARPVVTFRFRVSNSTDSSREIKIRICQDTIPCWDLSSNILYKKVNAKENIVDYTVDPDIFMATFQSQQMNIKLILDPDNLIKESNETNNAIEMKIVAPKLIPGL